MGLFSFLRKKKSFFTPEENHLIVKAIGHAEEQTSGEVRVYVESHCSWVDPMDRAAEIFLALRMHETKLRNGVLVYVAVKDHQLAVFGDEGIHQKVGSAYWNERVMEMIGCFQSDKYAEGIGACVLKIGHALKENFPYEKGIDKNELPDEIVFGK
jgi:uncharacterized membrane protein